MYSLNISANNGWFLLLTVFQDINLGLIVGENGQTMCTMI